MIPLCQNLSNVLDVSVKTLHVSKEAQQSKAEQISCISDTNTFTRQLLIQIPEWKEFKFTFNNKKITQAYS